MTQKDLLLEEKYLIMRNWKEIKKGIKMQFKNISRNLFYNYSIFLFTETAKRMHLFPIKNGDKIQDSVACMAWCNEIMARYRALNNPNGLKNNS